ncbi:MAG: DNA-protecting protein DprA [Actinobacteria bacterium]|nr:DNA-protecting protein DprA [Actinomycetota bacterium]
MLDEKTAKLILFSAFDPVDTFWQEEVLSNGAVNTYQKIIKGFAYLKVSNFPQIRDRVFSANVENLKSEIFSAKAEFISCEDIDWPVACQDLQVPPIGLVIKGDRKLLTQLGNSISIVGSRRPTNYGLNVANQLATDACKREIVVISGGAYGIDTAAHKASLFVGGKTIAVLAGGINNLYPPENLLMFTQIAESGLLISEVMPTRDAAEIFRPVFAIPGEISSKLSDGCHRLIAERIADIATSLDEIVEVIKPLQLR